MSKAHDIRETYLHVRDGGNTDTVPLTDSFWNDLTSGQRPDLEQGRLMTAFTFSEPWSSWERHPAGEELVMLLTGDATMVLEEAGGHRSVRLSTPGAYVLVPPNTWHTARTSVASTLLFLTPGAGTEHRPVEV